MWEIKLVEYDDVDERKTSAYMYSDARTSTSLYISLLFWQARIVLASCMHSARRSRGVSTDEMK